VAFAAFVHPIYCLRINTDRAMPAIFEIPLSRLDLIFKRLKKAERRNPVSGLPLPRVTVLERYATQVEVHDSLARIRGKDTDTRIVSVATARIEVDGFTARTGDWEMVGYRRQRVVKTAAGDRLSLINLGSVPDGKRKTAICCEHCGTVRKRTTSYIASKADGTKTVEVGGSCLASFLGTDVIPGFASGIEENASVFAEIAGYAERGLLDSDEDIADETITVLAVACNILSREPLVTSKQAQAAGTVPTWHKVQEDVRRYRSEDADAEDISVGIADFIKAQEVAEWLVEEAIANPSPFIVAAREVVGNGMSQIRDIAVLTAAVASRDRDIVRRKNMTESEAIADQSRYVGMVGEKREIVAKVKSIRPYTHRFGSGEVVTILDGADNLVVWFASAKNHGLMAGKTFVIEGTVKKHDISGGGMYARARQTVLTRVKVLKDLGVTQDIGSEVERNRDKEDFVDLLMGLR
jgi:hypothetical protein